MRFADALSIAALCVALPALAFEAGDFPPIENKGVITTSRVKASSQNFQRLGGTGSDWAISGPSEADLLLIAAVNGADLAGAKSALGRDANPNARDDSGQSMLITAIRQNELTLVRELVAHGADVNAGSQGLTPLGTAVLTGESAIVKYLLKSGADAKARDGSGRAPLLHAISTRRSDIAKLLLAAGADPNRRGPGSELPLLMAAENGDLASTEFLLAYGADPNVVNRDNVSPLLLALVERHWAVAGKLLEKGARPNATEVGLIAEMRRENR